MSDLPAGWTLSTLEELAVNPTADIVDGPFGSNLKASEYQEEGIPIIRLQNVKRSRFIDKNIKYVSSEKAKELQRHSFVAGDLVITKLGDPLGEAAIVPDKFNDGIIVADIVRARLDTRLADKKYVMYAINSPEIIKSLETEVKGTTRPRVNLGHIRRLQIPLAPLNEQKRIAEKLDSLLTRVDSCQSHLERVPQILKRFRQSVLAAATSGRLTEEWREKQGKNVKPWLETIPEDGAPLPKDYERLGKIAFKLTIIDHSAKDLPETWSLLTIADLYNNKTLIDFADGNHGAMYPRKEDFGDKGALFLTATQIGENWEVDINACPRLRSDKAEKLVKGWARKNDVLLTHNATVGRVALLEFGEEDVLLGTSVTFYRFNEKYILPNYGRILFSSPFFQDQLKMEMAQTTRNQVPITKQVSFNFICPPLEEQAEIVRRVESLFAYAERLEACYLSASERVERLTPSLLGKAFRGELVEQEPPPP